MINKFFCSTCNRYFYNGWGAHLCSYEHKIKVKIKHMEQQTKEKQKQEEKKQEEKKQEEKKQEEKKQEEKKQEDIEFKYQLESALEGWTLNPGDEVSLRDGRFFKVDIHGILFEIPIGS